jgi:hypothetical protein
MQHQLKPGMTGLEPHNSMYLQKILWSGIMSVTPQKVYTLSNAIGQDLISAVDSC